MTWSDELSNAGHEVTAAVCLAHGRFVPCRKSGTHDVTSEPDKVELVRYYQQMSAREQQSAWQEPEYEEEVADWQDRYICITEQYGDHSLACGGHVLAATMREPARLIFQSCSEVFGGWTARMIFEDIRTHFTTVKHYQLKVPGRKGNAASRAR